MKKVVFLALAMSIVLLSSCDSKFSKLTDNAAEDAREYIDAFNNAKSAEEVRAIERDFEERGEYYEREFEKINNETSIKEKQRVMQNEKYNGLGDEVKSARRNARDRFK